MISNLRLANISLMNSQTSQIFQSHLSQMDRVGRVEWCQAFLTASGASSDAGRIWGCRAYLMVPFVSNGVRRVERYRAYLTASGVSDGAERVELCWVSRMVPGVLDGAGRFGRWRSTVAEQREFLSPPPPNSTDSHHSLLLWSRTLDDRHKPWMPMRPRKYGNIACLCLRNYSKPIKSVLYPKIEGNSCAAIIVLLKC